MIPDVRAARPAGPGPPAGSGVRGAVLALLPWLAMMAAFAHTLTAGWRRWGDLVLEGWHVTR